MPKYLYILSAEKPFDETEVNRVKDEICQLFGCTEAGVSGRQVFTLQSAFGPVEVERLAADAWERFRLHFKAGGRIH